MTLRRIARSTLSLAVAYAIVLGGVLGPALGHGFDPASALCAPGSGTPVAGHGTDLPQPQAVHDCCLVLCGGQPGLLPPATVTDRAVSYAPAIWTPLERSVSKENFARARSARAPPLG